MFSSLTFVLNYIYIYIYHVPFIFPLVLSVVPPLSPLAEEPCLGQWVLRNDIPAAPAQSAERDCISLPLATPTTVGMHAGLHTTGGSYKCVCGLDFEAFCVVQIVQMSRNAVWV
jgi:hypothetical protein